MVFNQNIQDKHSYLLSSKSLADHIEAGYDQKWSANNILLKNQLWISKKLPFNKKLSEGDDVFLREFGNSIYGNATISRITDDSHTWYITFDYVTGLIKSLPQKSFFDHYTGSKRSRCGFLNSEARSFLEENDLKNENLFIENLEYELGYKLEGKLRDDLIKRQRLETIYQHLR